MCQLTITEWPHSCPVLSKMYVNWLLQNDHTAVPSCPKCMSTDCYRMATQLSRPVQNVCQLTVTEWPHSYNVLSCPQCMSTVYYRMNTQLSFPVTTIYKLTVTEWTHICLFLSPLYVNWLLQNDHTAVLSCSQCMSTDCYRMFTLLSCPVNTVCQMTVQNDHTAVLSCPHCISTDCTEWPHRCPVLPYCMSTDC